MNDFESRQDSRDSVSSSSSALIFVFEEYLFLFKNRHHLCNGRKDEPAVASCNLGRVRISKKFYLLD